MLGQLQNSINLQKKVTKFRESNLASPLRGSSEMVNIVEEADDEPSLTNLDLEDVNIQSFVNKVGGIKKLMVYPNINNPFSPQTK